jgi:hypothetical protein
MSIPRTRPALTDLCLSMWIDLSPATRVAIGIVGGILGLALIAHVVAR